MRVALTDRFCDRGKPGDYFDETVPGLALRIGSRTKTWSLHFTLDGLRKRLPLGSYPSLSLSAARRKAMEARTAISEGHDPKAIVGSDTLRSICEDYLRREAPERSKEYYEEQLQRLVYPVLGARPISEIRRSEIVRMLDGIEAPSLQGMVLKIVRRIMNWHATRDDHFVSPIVKGMSRQASTPRDRILTDEEIRSVWNTEHPLTSMVRFLLLTGCRRTEAYEMTWDELRGREWTLPAARNKTKVELVRPLSALALSSMPSHAPSGVPAGGQNPSFVFRRVNLSHAKIAFDGACGVRGWTLHDLRRTARSLMSRAGVPSDHAERCLGHVIGGVRGVYDRHRYLEEMALAYEKLASQIERIVHPQENVVSMRGASQ
jgi:integrase